MNDQFADPKDYFVGDVMSRMDDLTALHYASLAQERSAGVGFDFASARQAMAKVHEEILELEEAFTALESDADHFAEELGDCFFALVNVCRHTALDPERLLKMNTNKYLERCRQIERQLATADQSWGSTTPEEIHALWRLAKLHGQ